MKPLFVLVALTSLNCIANNTLPGLIRLTPSNAARVAANRQSFSGYCSQVKSEDYVKCKDDKEIQWTLNVYESADLSSKKIGKIVVTLIAKNEPTAKFYDTDGKAQDYVPNLVNDYGSHFDFSVLKQQGDWIQLPKNPFGHPIWVNIVKDWKETELKSMLEPIEIGMVYTHAKLGDIVFIKISGDRVEYRDSYEKDMDCGQEGINPKAKKPKSKEISIKDLLDKDGHLPIFETYWKGC